MKIKNIKLKTSLLVVLATMLAFSGFSQIESRKPVDLVAQSKYRTPYFQEVDIFNIDLVTSRSLDQVDRQVEEYDLFDIDDEALAVLIRDMPSAMTLSIPINFRESMELELVAVDIFSSDFTVVQRSDNSVVEVNTGLHYRGIIKGDNNSIAAISIYKDEVTGLVSSEEGNLVIGKLQDRTSNQKHIIYDDANVLSDLGIECGTEYDGGLYRDEQLEFDENARDVGDCVRFYVEVDKDIYDDKGGTAGATNYITGLMNQVSTLYANEQISTVVSQIVVWNVASPYNGSTSVTMLNSFAANTNSINGDLGILLSYRASGGVANYYAGLCNSNVDLSLCFASIYNTYSAAPTYSWSVGVITHEFGHLLGSYHTHSCVWNGNNTAIDGCYTVEGSCGSPGYPAGGGSIMSYCHLAGGPGISFNVGFGPQPGNVIRNSVANASCLSSGCGGGGATCDDGIQNGNETGVDCGGSCAPCDGGCNAPTANEVGSSNIANTTATLNYNGNETFADYQYRQSGSGTWIGTNYSSNGYMNISGLTAGTQYEYQINIWCGSNWSAWSASKTFTTTGGGGGGCNAPAANEVGSSNIANTTATLNYNGNATFADYQYRQSGSGTWIGTNYSSNGYMNISGLTAGTQYEYQINIWCGSNWSAWSASKTFTTTGGGGGGCNAPAASQINSSNIGSTTVSLNYTGSEDFSIFQYKVAGSSTFTIANYSSTGVTNLSGLTAGTQYEYQGGIWCGSNWSPWTSSKYFTTTGGGGGNAYCNSNGNTTSDEWINRVQFGGINNTSGNNGGYANYTGTSTVVNANTNVSWTLVPGFSSSVYSEYWTIWIDFNQDGDFNDSGEMVSQGNGTSTITGSAYIPSNVPSGSTRMRVSMKYNGYSSPCESFQYGEVEDYTIVIGSAMPEGVNSFIQNKNILGIHPNPAMEYVQLDFNANSSGEALVELVNLTGRTVKLLHKEVLEGENILRLNLSDLPEGTYIVQIKTGKEKFVGKIAVVR